MENIGLKTAIQEVEKKTKKLPLSAKLLTDMSEINGDDKIISPEILESAKYRYNIGRLNGGGDVPPSKLDNYLSKYQSLIHAATINKLLGHDSLNIEIKNSKNLQKVVDQINLHLQHTIDTQQEKFEQYKEDLGVIDIIDQNEQLIRNMLGIRENEGQTKEKLTRKISNLHDSLYIKNEELKKEVEVHKYLEREVEKFRGQIDTLNEIILLNKENKEESEKYTSALKAKNKELTEKEEKAKNENNLLKEKNEKQEKQIEKLEEDFSSTNQKIGELENMIKDLTEKYSQASEENEKLKSENTKLEEISSKLEQENKKLEEKYNNELKENKGSKEENKELVKQVKTSETENQNLQKEIEGLKRENEELKKKTQRLVTENEELKEKDKEKNKDLEQENKDLKENNEELNTKVKNLEEKNKKMATELKILKDMIAKAVEDSKKEKGDK